jgi:ABC-type branched-subunit amino acid transport system substrate-binding protein
MGAAMKRSPPPLAVARPVFVGACLALLALGLVACGARAHDAGRRDDTVITRPGREPVPTDPDLPDSAAARPPVTDGRPADDSPAPPTGPVDEDVPPGRVAPPADDPTAGVPFLSGPPGRRVMVLVPMTGRSAPLGTALAAGLAAARGPSTEAGPELLVRDVALDSTLASALAEVVRDPSIVGIAAVVDRSGAADLAERGAATGRPVLMVTAAEAAVEHAGRVWRVFPTPALTVRTAAGAGLARGGKRAAIVRPQTAAAEALAGLFRAVWLAGGGALDPVDLTYDPSKPEWAKVAARLEAGGADTVFFPESAVIAAQALATFASVGVWSASPTRTFERSRVRTFTFLGTPDWYAPDVMRQSGRYFEGALIPVAFATESVPGARLAARFSAAGRGVPNAVDALLWESVLALDAAGQAAVHTRANPLATLRGTQTGQVTVGLRFDQPDALQSLYVLTVRDGRFAAAR